MRRPRAGGESLHRRSETLGQPSGLVHNPARPGQTCVRSLVRLGRARCLALDADAMAGCEFGHGVDNAASDAPAPCTDRNHDRRFIARADNHVMRAAGAMEEVPCSQAALLILDD